MVEHSPFALFRPLIEWSGMESSKSENGYKTGGEGGVCSQYDASTQGQNFAQNGRQKRFCTGLEVSYSVTKTSTGMRLRPKQSASIKNVRLMDC